MQAAGPAIYYRLADSGPTTIADSSGSSATGTYQGSGTTFGVTGACPRDNNPAVTLNESSAYIVTPNLVTNPTVFPLEM